MKAKAETFRRILTAFVMLTAYAFADEAFAGTVHKICYVPVSEVRNPIFDGAQIILKNKELNSRGRCEISFSGKIVSGDAEKIASAIIANPYVVSTMKFNSPGGYAFERLKIADVINKYFVTILTRVCYEKGACDEKSENVFIVQVLVH